MADTSAPQLTQDQLFARFWACYPRKVAKRQAKITWAKLRPDVDLVQTMLAALAWQSQLPSAVEEDGKYFPHASSWLNGERWDDEMPASMKPRVTWHDECAELHGSTCLNHQDHWWKKVREEQAKVMP